MTALACGLQRSTCHLPSVIDLKLGPQVLAPDLEARLRPEAAAWFGAHSGHGRTRERIAPHRSHLQRQRADATWEASRPTELDDVPGDNYTYPPTTTTPAHPDAP